MSNNNKVELYRRMKNLVHSIKRKSIDEMKEMYGKEISHAEFRVLLFINLDEGTSMGKIAGRWSMQMSNLNKVVGSLIERGYIYKKQSEPDKRVKMLFLTEEGDRIKNKFIAEFEKKINKSLENVNDKDIETALETVNSILEQIQGE
ncbi:MAG: MarR family transcriptional regulator [Clostridia bacterium]|nr:MarR family transcriptional regulator [Clostridia bacterium]